MTFFLNNFADDTSTKCSCYFLNMHWIANSKTGLSVYAVFSCWLVEAYHSVESSNIKNACVRLLSRLRFVASLKWQIPCSRWWTSSSAFQPLILTSVTFALQHGDLRLLEQVKSKLVIRCTAAPVHRRLVVATDRGWLGKRFVSSSWKKRRAIQSAMKWEFCCTVGWNVEQY